MKLPHKILELSEHQKFMGVAGGRGDFREKELLEVVVGLGRKYRVLVQAFDARAIAGIRHLVHAVTLCLAARSHGEKIARSQEIDLLCWAAGERQIEVAVKKVGVKAKSPVVIVAVGREVERIRKAMREIFLKSGLQEDPGVIEMSQEKVGKIKEAFGIKDEELICSVEKLVLEKIALLAAIAF
ncbi:MAG: KEOPS complex subunit Cgi121 [Candidatus Hadarchaeales archaeon]